MVVVEINYFSRLDQKDHPLRARELFFSENITCVALKIASRQKRLTARSRSPARTIRKITTHVSFPYIQIVSKLRQAEVSCSLKIKTSLMSAFGI
jgi:hypothetical protein